MTRELTSVLSDKITVAVDETCSARTSATVDKQCQRLLRVYRNVAEVWLAVVLGQLHLHVKADKVLHVAHYCVLRGLDRYIIMGLGLQISMAKGENVTSKKSI